LNTDPTKQLAELRNRRNQLLGDTTNAVAAAELEAIDSEIRLAGRQREMLAKHDPRTARIGRDVEPRICRADEELLAEAAHERDETRRKARASEFATSIDDIMTPARQLQDELHSDKLIRSREARNRARRIIKDLESLKREFDT
jgi:hypothetical protein